ncbi:pogo transposable element with ZNF domain isoform X2 [Solea solea]|uniref:pogo transposable element with ZNF domain isoform X2 n=1 Tax=Solea solea TaxID=90069 RepID=UPI00272CC7A2|nr:pogo transposable element with ZNF domain isoform X2 [Solea solea]
MEVQCDAGGDTDLTMECDEDETSSLLSSSSLQADEKKEDEGLKVRVRSLEEEMDQSQTRIISIPKQLMKNCSTPTLTASAVPLGFRLNGQLVPLLPGGGAAELKLCSQPRGSVSGFTVTVTGSHHINNTTAPPTADTHCPEPEAQADSTPIITGVISGEEAQKVLNQHNLNFKFTLPLANQKTLKTPPHIQHAPPTITQLTPPAAWRTLAPPTSSNRTATSHKLQHKGQQEHVSPPNCLNCASHYKFIKQLRGFMCLCSPGIAQSLENLKKKRRSREEKMTLQRSSDDVLSDPDSPVPEPAYSPLRECMAPPPGSPQGKLVMLVEDFFYGSALGQSPAHTNRLGPQSREDFCCVFCPTTIRNNIEFMSHTLQHDAAIKPSCPHCYRRFLSPFKLQCHLEGDHSRCMSSATCRICERNFGSEPRFLLHMKRVHKPGEMPYVCQVCDFRSSFYSDVWSHFEDVHADTKYLLCHYCLMVLVDESNYQHHVTQHQKKYMFDCDKCRLHFLYAQQRNKHQELHKTYIKPAQLTGLTPGTKVTVRTYSVVEGAENDDEVVKKVVPCKVIKVDSPPPAQEVTKRKKVESLGPLLSGLSEEAGVSPLLCVECLSTVRDVRNHFPSLVHCSLCRFITCCSTSYANHMINNHVTFSENQPYQSIFLTNPRSSHRLECVSCKLSTYKGDVMANHLTERPEHHCRVHTDWSIYREQHTHTCDSVTSAGDLGHSGFVPIHLMSSSKMTSTQLSVKPLPSPSPLCSEPAMTIIIVGPRPQSDQLAAVLSSLCHGVAQASHRCQTASEAILSWTEQQERGLRSRNWHWKTARSVSWLLRQRELQLAVSEDVLLQVATTFLGQDSQLTERYRWSVDFMLRHDSSCLTLPMDIRDKCHMFVQPLHDQLRSTRLLPRSIGCMDEFSIFIGHKALEDQNPTAFQLFASPEVEPLLDVFLSALSDGTLLTPLLFFRRMPSHVPEGFPSNVLLEARQDGFSDQERLNIWINKVWRPCMEVSGHSRESVLLVDSHRGHLTSQFKDDLSSISTDVMVIPPGCSCRLQPLHICVTPVLQDFLQARWTQLVYQGGLDGLGLDHLALMFTCWLSELCSTLNSQTGVLHRSFSSVLDPQVKDCVEAATMIRDLKEALIQTLETPEPQPEPEHEHEPEPEPEHEPEGPGLGLLQTKETVVIEQPGGRASLRCVS